MRYMLFILLLLISFVTAMAQETRPRRTVNSTAVPSPPRLQTPSVEEYSDELSLWGNRSAYFRIGKNILIPLTDSPSIQIGLDATLSTKGMRGVTINRGLITRVDILTKYGDKLSVKDSIVETRISGHQSGFKSRALLLIEPRTIQFRSNTPTMIGFTQDGTPIFLKPGVWELHLHCTIQAIEAENTHWYAANDSESTTIKGKRFGSGASQSVSDPYYDLQYIAPFGAVAYNMTRLVKMVGVLFRRPNINLPSSSQLFFRIDRIEATYLAPLIVADSPQQTK